MHFLRKVTINITNLVKNGYWVLGMLLVSHASFANAIIPISTADQQKANENFATTIIRIFQTGILPLLELLGGIYILWKALTGIWSGFEDYQKTKESDRLKQAVINSAILIVVGGAILFALDALRVWSA